MSSTPLFVYTSALSSNVILLNVGEMKAVGAFEYAYCGIIRSSVIRSDTGSANRSVAAKMILEST